MEYVIRHHGILGQKWGKRNGPPYPLDRSDYSAEEKRQADAIKFKARVGANLASRDLYVAGKSLNKSARKAKQYKRKISEVVDKKEAKKTELYQKVTDPNLSEQDKKKLIARYGKDLADFYKKSKKYGQKYQYYQQLTDETVKMIDQRGYDPNTVRTISQYMSDRNGHLAADAGTVLKVMIGVNALRRANNIWFLMQLAKPKVFSA